MIDRRALLAAALLALSSPALAADPVDVAKAKQEGKSGQALQDEVLPELQAQYGSWGFFKNFAPRNIAQTEAELSGTKRVPQPAGE